jgi:molybdate transport system substrate-binding protein
VRSMPISLFRPIANGWISSLNTVWQTRSVFPAPGAMPSFWRPPSTARCDPSTAPFGRYAKEALVASGLWDRVKHKIQTRKNIELLADSLALSSPSTVGILFKTNLTDRLRQLNTVDKTLHKPIRYYLAPLKASAGKADVAAFLEFMQGKAAKDVFQAEGFDVGAP